jgi:membrane protein DedA with SNARE-associated domain
MNFLYNLILNFKIRLFSLNNYYIFIPIFVFLISFIEVSSPIGFILPSDLFSILLFTFISTNIKLFLFVFLLYWSGIFLWLLVWYYLWYYFYDKINILLYKKFPNINKYLLKIDSYFDKYHFTTFFFISNIPYIRSYFAMHMWSRRYNFGRYLLWSVFFSFFYVLPRAIIGFLMWKFWQVIVSRYLNQWKMLGIYILLIIFLILIIFYVFKYNKKKNLNKKK